MSEKFLTAIIIVVSAISLIAATTSHVQASPSANTVVGSCHQASHFQHGTIGEQAKDESLCVPEMGQHNH